jgi:hypothetical protein
VADEVNDGGGIGDAIAPLDGAPAGGEADSEPVAAAVGAEGGSTTKLSEQTAWRLRASLMAVEPTKYRCLWIWTPILLLGLPQPPRQGMLLRPVPNLHGSSVRCGSRWHRWRALVGRAVC